MSIESALRLGPWLLLVATIAYLVCEAVTFSRLKKHHPQIWEDLGRPTLLATSHPRVRKAFTSWVRKREDRQVGDSGLQALVTTGRAIQVSFWFVLIITVIIEVAR